MKFDAKKQSEQHLIDADGQRLLRSRLPRHWILREYRPDHGLDFALEIFALPKKSATPATYETLGEHLFIQLKTVRTAEVKSLRLYGRKNVEKQREAIDKEDLVGELETIRFPLETQEIFTVDRMGVGVPVLLVIADLSRSQCFFVCLNDYIDKILIPRHDDYRSKETRTIHIPLLNEVGTEVPGQTALRWYAKRPKLYAAFQRFVFQAAEIRNEYELPNGPAMARYFASRIAAYDFWDDTEMWALIPECGKAVRKILTSGSQGTTKIDEETNGKLFATGNAGKAQELIDHMKRDEIPELWRQLSVLPRFYEDVCREWFLPTGLGFACSYQLR